MQSVTSAISIFEKIKLYFQLLKFRLSSLVVFSAALIYVLAAQNDIVYLHLIVFCIGGFLITGSANIINQIIEVDYDKLMGRTMNRPLPTGMLNKSQAAIFSFIIGVIGLSIHFFACNPLTALLSFISLILYGFVYTPLKRVGPIAVFVGAIPGAMPPLLGWVAVQGEITSAALVLYGIQFIWQFPHFWAIAWIADEDYTKAGFKLLPSRGGKNINTALNIMTYTLFLIPISLIPYVMNLTGSVSAIIVTITGILFLVTAFRLMKNCDRKSALFIMFGSFFYLPIVQIAYVLDKVQ